MIGYEVVFHDEDVLRRLARLGQNVSEINKRALGDVAEQIVKHSQINYMRSKGPGEGRLNDQRGPGSLRSIRGSRGLRGRISYIIDDNFTGRVGVMKPGPGFEYAAVHEYGRGKIPARPYVGPAVDDVFQTNTAERLMEKRFQRELKEAFNRA